MKIIKTVLLFGLLAIVNSYTRCTDPMQLEFLLQVVEKLQAGENVIFTKYGDGEYNCMKGDRGCNVDSDAYHPWLASALKQALISLSNKPNTYIGRWWTPDAVNYCDVLAAQHGTRVPWAWYHLFMNDDNFLAHNYMYEFVKFVVETDRKKIILCNSMNKKMKVFFRADVLIEIPSSSWSFEYAKWKNILEAHVEQNSIILISGGLCSKVLIDDITNEYNVTFIDLGSSFDLLCRDKKTRPWNHNLADELKYYKDLLPENWSY